MTLMKATMDPTDPQVDTLVEEIATGGGITAFVVSGDEPDDVEVVVLRGGIERAKQIATLISS